MAKKDMTVSLDEFLAFLLKKWIIILGTVVIFVGLFCVSAKMLGEKIVFEPSEKLATLLEEAEFVNSYIENAPFMKINAANVHECTIYLSEISDKSSLANYLDSGHIFDEYEYEFGKYQLVELTTWIETADPSAVEIKVQHYDEESCEFMTNYLVRKIQLFDENLEVFVGTQHVTADRSVTEEQLWYIDRKRAVEGQLEYTRKGYTIEASLPIAAVAGVMFGGITSVCMLFVWFYIEHKKRV